MATTSTAGRCQRAAGAGLLVGALLFGAACSSDDDRARGTGATPEVSASPAGPALAWVALGDSFSSGQGAPPYEADSGVCLRSSGAWPKLLAAAAPERIASLDHRACSGAVVADLLTIEGQGPRAELPARPQPDVDLVTVTVGGNDVGFGAVVGACAADACPDLDASGYGAVLDGVRAHLVDELYPTLRRTYPNAQIVHVGYPRLTPVSGEASVGCPWLSEDDQQALDDVIVRLDLTISDAADAAGITYVDLTDAFRRHELCALSSWLAPLGDPAAGHPVPAGQRAMEAAVAEALDVATGS
jgi:lysophospholipase L1-like esterase